MGLMSDAGTPGIADPGALIVSKAHKIGCKSKTIGRPLLTNFSDDELWDERTKFCFIMAICQ